MAAPSASRFGNVAQAAFLNVSGIAQYPAILERLSNHVPGTDRRAATGL
jgi:hypothetical protein